MSLTQRLATVSAAHPWRMLGAWGITLVASIAIIGALLGSAITTDADITTKPDSKRAADLMLASFPQQAEGNEVVVVHSQALTAQDPRFRQFVSDLRASMASTDVTSPISDPYVAPGPATISQDQHSVVLTFSMGGNPEENIEKVLAQIDAARANPEFQTAITGKYTLGYDFTKLSEHDLQKGELQIGLPAALIILLIVFGAVVAALIPMGIAIVSIIVSLALAAVVGQAVTLSFFIVNMVTAMGLALGIDYSLFVLSRYREERHLGLTEVESIVASGGTASKAVLFSGSSFVLALCGLLLVPDTILRSLAFGAILVGIATVVAALTLLPALIAVLGDRVWAWRLPLFGRDRAAESSFWTRAVRRVVARPWVAFVASVAFLLLLAAPVLGLSTGSSGVSTLPEGTYAKAGFESLERAFPGSVSSDPAEIVLTGDVRSPGASAAITRLESTLTDDARFGTPSTEVAQDGQVAVMSVPVRGDPSGDNARGAVEDLRERVVATSLAGTDLTAYVGGSAAEIIDYTDLINFWLPIVLTFVLLVSFLLLTLLFRSIVLSATAVVLNLLSVAAAWGLLVLVFQRGWGADLLGFQQVQRIEAWVPIFLFTVLFALSMDYHVFLITRIRERFAQTGDTDDAVRHGIALTGRIITGAALIIVAVFAGFAAGDLVMFQQMGFGIGVALLLDATVIRMVVVPSVMALLGPWNWYLPSWLSWLPELHVEGDLEAEHGARDRVEA